MSYKHCLICLNVAFLSVFRTILLFSLKDLILPTVLRVLFLLVEISGPPSFTPIQVPFSMDMKIPYF